MDNQNLIYTSISTDKALSTILSNFSEDFIQNMIEDSLQYKFRPFTTRMPNHPYVLEEKFKGIYDNYDGDDKELISQTRYKTYLEIIQIVCANYNLSISDPEIPEEQIYTLCYTLYQILVSEFTDRMINFYAQYVYRNVDSLINALPEDQRISKTVYAKKLYAENDQKYVIIYDNMELIVGILAQLDIPFEYLLAGLSDEKTAVFIATYIQDLGDIYKNYFASYLISPASSADMITAIKLKIVSFTAQNAAILDPNNNPCILQ